MPLLKGRRPSATVRGGFPASQRLAAHQAVIDLARGSASAESRIQYCQRPGVHHSRPASLRLAAHQKSKTFSSYRICEICGGVLSFSTNTVARVAQWIRAFASGAKGRRFDPCRGYHYPRLLPSISARHFVATAWLDRQTRSRCDARPCHW
jgi:NADH pyrophosphatase NudC (nudix superfamily)